MESPFRQPDVASPEPEAPPVLRLAPRYVYEQPARKAPLVWLAVFAAMVMWLMVDAMTGSSGGRKNPWGLLLSCGWVPVMFAWLAWMVRRTRFALELQPEAGRLLVLRCSFNPVGGWEIYRDLALSDVDAVDVRGERGRGRHAVLVLGQGTSTEADVELGWVTDAEQVAAIGHWVEQAKVISAKHRAAHG